MRVGSGGGLTIVGGSSSGGGSGNDVPQTSRLSLWVQRGGGLDLNTGGGSFTGGAPLTVDSVTLNTNGRPGGPAGVVGMKLGGPGKPLELTIGDKWS